MIAETPVAAPADSSRGTVPARAASAPVRVVGKVPAAASSASAPAAGAPAAGPVRLPTAPVKNGRAYDWTGLP